MIRSLRSAVILGVLSVAGCGHEASSPPPAQQVIVGNVGLPQDGDLPKLAAAAGEGSASAVARLRMAGPKGLAAVLAVYDATPETDVARRERLSSAIDTVARQKDARASRLYWYTDLDAAKEASRASGKPILSLRLLGQLDDELSCANSRYFRTALYPNREVKKLLEEKFILHWSSERPAPVVTIDFRDGRVLKRTVTGNSLHYVLDGEGRVVDAIPGLWGPAAFAKVVGRAGEIAREVATLPDGPRAERLTKFHAASLDALRTAWAGETVAARVAMAFPVDAVVAPRIKAPSARNAPPPAMVALNVAPSKMISEVRVVKAAFPAPSGIDLSSYAETVAWERFAPAHAGECVLDPASVALIREKRPRSWTDASALGRALDDAELASMIGDFQTSMAEDTVKNMYLYHGAIHRWLADALEAKSGADAFASLNAKIYAELFRTPASDPWLGLVPPNAFTAIQDDGIAH